MKNIIPDVCIGNIFYYYFWILHLKYKQQKQNSTSRLPQTKKASVQQSK